MKDKLLLVDDEVKVLASIKRQLAGQYEVHTAQSGSEGLLALVEYGPFPVVISDLCMPGMDGIRFLSEVKRRIPDTVRVMLTGNADLESAIDAVNQGYVFRFLTKPCPQEVLLKTIRAGVEYHRLVTAERELLEKTLSGSVKVLTEMLSLVNPAAFGRTLRIKRYVKQIVDQLRLPHAWQFELASMLSLIGCVTLSSDTLEKIYAGATLDEEEERMFEGHPMVARNLLANIPRLSTVARMIEAQQQPFVRGTSGDNLLGEDMVALGGHLLKVAMDFDRLLIQGGSLKGTLHEMEKQPEIYAPEILKALGTLELEPLDRLEKLVKVREVNTSMVLDEDLRAKNGMLLAIRGQEITYTMMQRLRAFASRIGVDEPFRVLVKSAVSS